MADDSCVLVLQRYRPLKPSRIEPSWLPADTADALSQDVGTGAPKVPVSLLNVRCSQERGSADLTTITPLRALLNASASSVGVLSKR
jgi:hypothetical protein